MSIRIEDVDCRYCFEEEVYMDVKEEPSHFKIGARCNGCGRDYGVIDRVSLSHLSHQDEVYELGESSIRELLE